MFCRKQRSDDRAEQRTHRRERDELSREHGQPGLLQTLVQTPR